MDDNFFRANRRLSRTEDLVRAVASDRFGRHVLEFVSQAGPIRNFGTYYCADQLLAGPILSFWYGTISSYWFRKNAADIISSVQFRELMRRQALSVPAGNVAIELWRPPQDHQLHKLFRRVGILERIAVTSRSELSSSQTFFLRSRSDGPVSAKEMKEFALVLPLAHELINLRHRIVGSEAFSFLPTASVSGLRARGIVSFLKLTPRETDVCDCLVKGLTVKGTALHLDLAETSVRTLRQRAYRKLNIVSAYELLAMLAKEGVANAS